MKFKILLLLAILMVSNTYAQEEKLFIEAKFNIASVIVGIVNPAVEIGFNKYSSITFEYIGSYANSNFMDSGHPLIINMVYLEYRRYILNRGHKGFFIAGGLGTMNYKMNKNVLPFLNNKGGNNTYDWGHGVVIGATLGYKFLIKDRFGIEVSASGGWQHSQHELYNKHSGDLLVSMNKTGEWTPYKAGVYLSYRF